MLRGINRWTARAALLRREVLTLYFALRHPDTPWYARAVAAAVVAYALSPIDLIPDFIPVLGYLDDVILLPAGIALVLRLTPAAVLTESRERAARVSGRLKASLIGAAVIVAIWVLCGLTLFALLVRAVV